MNCIKWGKKIEDESTSCEFCGVINYECVTVSDYAMKFTNIYSRKKTLIQVGHKYVYDPPNPKTAIEKRRKGRVVRLEEIYRYLVDRVLVKYIDTNKTVLLKNPFFLRDFESSDDEITISLFKIWINNISEEERELRNIALDYESKIFNDMRLIDYETSLFGITRYSRTLTCEESVNFYQSKNGKEYLDSIGVKTEVAFSDKADEVKKSISLNNWRFEFVEPITDEDGYCDEKLKVIGITKSAINDGIDGIILIHEMIHAYESLLREKGYDQYVVISLYNELSLYIKNLDEIINTDNNIVFKDHSILFG